jgi:CheY-like chemotaxis protein
MKALALLSRIPESVPDGLLAVALRIRQILTNLIGNAVKFTERGTVALRVECRPMSRECLELRLAVVDTGVGIPVDKHATIFQAFRQSDSSTTRQYGGTGLGLTISAHLAELLGGSIRMTSALGDGSRQALEAATSEALFHLILVDVQIPGTDGLEATRAIRLLPNLERIQDLQELLGMKVHVHAIVKDNRLYLHHMLERYQPITRFTRPGRDAFMASEELQDAVIRNVEAIGEAANRVSADTRGPQFLLPGQTAAATQLP